MILSIPLLILLAIFLPILIVTVILIAAAVGATSLLVSKAKVMGKKEEKMEKKAKGIIDVEYKVK